MSPQQTLLVLGGVALALTVGSNALLTGSRVLWEIVREHATGPGEERLQLEARLRTRSPDETELLIMGNSLVETNVSRLMLPSGLGIQPRQVEYVWIPAANALELAMLTPDLVALEPRTVVYLATVWTLYGPIDYDQVRIYNPKFAFRLFGGNEFLEQRSMHGTGLLESSHVVLRQRGPLRRLMLRNVMREPGVVPPEEHAEAFRQIRESARREDFSCPNVQTRALRQMIGDFRQADVEVLVVGTPVRHRWALEPELMRELDACLAELVSEEDATYLPLSDLPPFEPRDFVDDMHMTPVGQAKFTRTLLAPLRGVHPD